MGAGGDPRIWASACGLAGLSLAGTALQRRHMKRVGADPAQELLRTPPAGRAFAVDSADGTTLHAEAFGPEDGATVVLAHGWTERLTYWTYVIRQLSQRGFRVVAYDLRGHGKSKTSGEVDFSLARFGEDLEAVLLACLRDGERAVVAGHSLGAMSIVAWAEHHDVEQRVKAAALVNTGVGDLIGGHLLVPIPWVARMINRTFAARGLLGARAPLPRFSTPISHAAIRYAAFGPSATPAQVAFYERMLISFPPDVRATVGIAISEMELHHAVPRLTVPTLVIAGSKDRLTPPAHARRIAEMLPRLAGLIELPGTGHMGPLERPGEISEALASLSAGVPVNASVAA